VASYKYLGIHISENLSWTTNTTAIVKKEPLYVLPTLRRANLSQHHLKAFYCSIESVLTYGILSWYGSSSAADRKSLQRIIKKRPKYLKPTVTYHGHHLQLLMPAEGTHSILPTICLNCCPQGNATGPSEHSLQDS